MTAETPQTRLHEVDEERCDSCIFDGNSCLRAVTRAVRSQDPELHNIGVRALIDMAHHGDGGIMGEISCTTPGCVQRQHIDVHYFVIDAL